MTIHIGHIKVTTLLNKCRHDLSLTFGGPKGFQLYPISMHVDKLHKANLLLWFLPFF
jgi:hypothetical protein